MADPFFVTGAAAKEKAADSEATSEEEKIL